MAQNRRVPVQAAAESARANLETLIALTKKYLDAEEAGTISPPGGFKFATADRVSYDAAESGLATQLAIVNSAFDSLETAGA